MKNSDGSGEATVIILVVRPQRVTVDSIVYEDMQIKLSVAEGESCQSDKQLQSNFCQSNNRMYSVKLLSSAVGSLLDVIEKNVTIVGDYIVMIASAQKMSNVQVESAGCTIGQSCKYISVGPECSTVYIGDSCSNITIDEKCCDINIANNC